MTMKQPVRPTPALKEEDNWLLLTFHRISSTSCDTDLFLSIHLCPCLPPKTGNKQQNKARQLPSLVWATKELFSQFQSCQSAPAVSDDGSSIRRVAGFDPAEEVEEGGGVLWNAMIGPRCELELTHLSSLTASTLI